MGEKMKTRVIRSGHYDATAEEAEAGEMGTLVIPPTEENPNPGVVQPAPPPEEVTEPDNKPAKEEDDE